MWEKVAFTLSLLLNPVLTQPRRESEMGTRTVFRTGLLSVPNGTTAQGMDAKLGVSRLAGPEPPDPFSVAPALRTMSSAREMGVGPAMRLVAS